MTRGGGLQQPGIRPRRRGARLALCPRRAGCCARLTGAEAALVVNNAAAALLLGAERAGGGARGDPLARPGGRDRRRLPHPRRDAPERGHAGRGRHHQPHLRPRLRGGHHARRPRGLLRVHASNFRVIGFTHGAGRGRTGRAGPRRTACWMVDDVGSGALLATAAYGLAAEPMVQESVAAGRRPGAASAATSCWAGRRPASSSGRAASGAPAPPPAGPRPAGGQGDAGRAGGHPAALPARRSARQVPVWRMIAPTPAALERAGAAAGPPPCSARRPARRRAPGPQRRRRRHRCPARRCPPGCWPWAPGRRPRRGRRRSPRPIPARTNQPARAATRRRPPPCPPVAPRHARRRRPGRARPAPVRSAHRPARRRRGPTRGHSGRLARATLAGPPL